MENYSKITKRVHLTFRAEAFNAMNTPHLWLPNTTVGSPQFGQISSTTGNPRMIQLALKMLF
jgi:hypothetical protein